MRTYFSVFVIATLFVSAAIGQGSEKVRIDYSEVRIKEFPIAVQSYTYRKFSFMEAVDQAVELGIKNLQAYPGQKLNKDGSGSFNVGMTSEQKEQVKKKLKERGITLNTFGVADITDESSGKELFEFAKEMDIKTIVIEPAYHLLPMIDKLANQYRINVAIHNHPKPSPYWHPGITYYYIKDLSKKIGICGDTGHWSRSGIVPSEAIKLLKGRIFDVHLKDLNEFGNMDAYDVPLGSGKSGIRDVLAELSLQNYHGTVTFEHEKDDDSMNPGPPILEGIGFIKKTTYYEGYTEILRSWDGRFNKHGWNHYGPGYFELDEESGVLTSSGGMGLMWYTAQIYTDFVLDLDFMCHSPNTNSGIFLRVPEIVTSNDYIYKSFEIQIQDADTLTKHTTGSVYDAEQAKMLASNPTGEWNHYRITFIGDQIKIELNGQLINNWNAEPRGKIKSFAKKGYIGLQNHDSHAKVSFKNIFIKELN